MTRSMVVSVEWYFL